MPDTDDGLFQRAEVAGTTALDYPALQALTGAGYACHWDEDAQAAWWYDGERFVSGEDARSLNVKLAYIRQKGLLGAAVWSWNSDPDAALLDAIQ